MYVVNRISHDMFALLWWLCGVTTHADLTNPFFPGILNTLLNYFFLGWEFFSSQMS